MSSTMTGHLTPTIVTYKWMIRTTRVTALEGQIVDTMTPGFVVESESENEKKKSKKRDLLENMNGKCKKNFRGGRRSERT